MTRLSIGLPAGLPVGSPPPDALGAHRLTLHWAANVVAAHGNTIATAAPDHSHAALAWRDGLLMGVEAGGVRAALRPEDFTLLALEPDGTDRDTLPLAGRTLPAALAWLAEAGGHGNTTLQLPSHDLPAHPAGEGLPFEPPAADAARELGRWFSSANAVLETAAGSLRGASPVRCWPHHFDVATLVTLASGTDGATRTVGIGMTPGDSAYAEPYWYVTPWPYPDRPVLPPLAGEGRWHTEGWTGAVLTGTDLLAAGDDGARGRRLADFLGTAVEACTTLAGGRLDEELAPAHDA